MAAPGLYVHVPLCWSICPYCDFSVLPARRDWPRRYVDGLLREIALLGQDGARRGWPGFVEQPPALAFDSLYFGGGTPSALPDGDLETVIGAIRAALPVADDVALFLEANPDDVTKQRAARWRALGVSTLSIGVQCFDDEALGFLGRRHRAKQARESVEAALAAGFATVSIDLIYGLPGQTQDAWRAELDKALDLGVQHLSCYQLTIHPRTPFGAKAARGELDELSNDGQADLFVLTHERLNSAGMSGYEVSNFARGATHRSAHNSKYWNHTPYLGLGPSAHSFADGTRWWNHRKIKPWLATVQEGALPTDSTEQLSAAELLLERLMLGLRTYDGVDLAPVPDLWRRNASLIEELERSGLASVTDRRVRATIAGLAVCDAIARSFAIG